MTEDKGQTFESLEEISTRKQKLLSEIQADRDNIKDMWDDLFHKEEESTPTGRFNKLMSTGAGVLDGIILGWKLYRKFKGGTSLFKKRRRR
jgi:hypothetical protein